ncbi:MAG TPA: ATP-binding protein, partial [Polyangiaceae bacterium]
DVTPDTLPWRRALDGEKPERMLVRIVDRATGRWSWSQVRTTSVNGSDGKPEIAITVFHDVTEVHRRERNERTTADATTALSSSLERDVLLSAFGEALVGTLADTCAVFVLEDKKLRDVMSNKPAAQVHWNVARSGKLEVTPRSLVVPIFVRGELVGALALANEPGSRRFDEEDIAIGTELARRAGVAIDNAALYAVAQDAARRAEDASRAKDEFLATVSHELRTPLNAIVGWATILKDRHLGAELARPLEVIHRNAVAQMKIVDDILDVSRVITGNFRLDPQPTDLVKLAEDAIDVVRPSAIAKHIDVELVRETSHCMLVIDPERMRQVLWNLLSNAAKFTDGGGKITVTIACDDEEARVVVADNGHGIEPAFLPHVFEPFKQADGAITRRVGGLGLGLALVRHFVELHGGSVEAASDGPGKGSTFSITLPLRNEAKPADEEEPEGTHRILTGVRVLVVDDEVDARELVAAVLSRAGADVETAESASDGMAKLQSFHPTMIISDIGMPIEDGYAFMRRVRAMSAAPSMALTAFASDADRAHAMEAGFTMHVAKPIDPDVLVTTVAMLARR